MKRGKRPTPTYLKIVANNPGRRPLNTAEPQPQGDLKTAPLWLTEQQRENWAYAIAEAPPGLLKRLDSALLTIWVIAEDLHRQASEKLAQTGMLVKAPHTGLPIQSPYMPIINKQASIMIKAAAELGFTPSSRTQISSDRPTQNAFANNGRRG